MLYETGMQIQQADFTDTVATQPVIELINYVVETYGEHAGHEDKGILPALMQYTPELVNQFENEHIKDHQLAEELQLAISTWQIAINSEEKYNAGRNILYAFNNFAAFNLEHMNREETVLLPELWKHYTDDELLKFNQQITRSIEAAKLLKQNRWMFKAMSAPEAVGLLQNAHKNAPPELYTALYNMAEEVMQPNNFALVKQALSVTLV